MEALIKLRARCFTASCAIALCVGIAGTGCAVGGGAPLVKISELVATPYDAAFDNAIAAMNAIGRIEREDRRAGLLFGQSRSGVNLDVEVKQTASGTANQILVKGSLPKGKVGLGSMTEPDEFLKAYERIANSRR